MNQVTGEVCNMLLVTRVLVVAAMGLSTLAPTALAGSADAAPARVTAATPAYVQPCGGPSWVAGTTDICNGGVVYRDYVNDDEGADLGEEGAGEGTDSSYNAFGSLSYPAGDVRYPAGDVNTADLVSLTLTRVGQQVQVVAQLAALYHPTSTTLAIAVGDADHPAAAKPWGALGVSSTGWDELYTFGGGDTASNTISGTFPMPAAQHLRVQALTAQTASNTVMNVAFRGPDEKAAFTIVNATAASPVTDQGLWFEDRQAAALKAGDISQFGVTVDAASLTPGVNQLAPVDPGLHERVYTSAYTVPGDPADGEGMSYAGVAGPGNGGTIPSGVQVFNLLGKYQPYGIYIPAAPGPFGMQMIFHGSGSGLAGIINQPGMQADFGDALHRILVVPEARGPNGYGSGLSERDLLDVMKDVQASYPILPDQVYSGGYSQGGYIAFRMAELYPQLFAGFTTWVGFTGDDLNGPAEGDGVSATAGAIGNAIDYVGNLRHVPGSMIYASADELVPVNSSIAMEMAFAKTDDVYKWYLHTPAEHLTFALLDNWQKEAIDSGPLRLQTNPAHVTYTTDPLTDDRAVGIVHDHAYWVSNLRGRTMTGPLTTDLTSHGCGVPVPTLATTNGTGTAPVAWTSINQLQTGTTPLPATQLLEGTLTNVASLTVDTSAACLTGSLPYSITSDGPGSLTLSDGRSIALVSGQNNGILPGPSAGAVAITPPAPSRKPMPSTRPVASPRPPAKESGPTTGRNPTTPLSLTTLPSSGLVPTTQPRRTLAFTGNNPVLSLVALLSIAGAGLLARPRVRRLKPRRSRQEAAGRPSES